MEKKGRDFPQGHPFTSVYDAVGNRTRLETVWGRFTYEYDARHDLTELADPGDPAHGLASARTTWTYDARGAVTRRDHPNGTRTTYTYDGDSRVVQLRHSQSDGTEVGHAYYDYDELGLPRWRQSRDGTCTWTYDNFQQLIAEQRPGAAPVTWSYDNARRRTLQESAAGRWTYSYDAADQVRTLAYDTGITTYAYDLSGNRVSREAPDATRTTYTWDAQDRLTSLEQPSGARLTSTYRHDGLRHARADGAGTQTFLWDGRDVLAVEGVNARRFARGVDLARNLGDGLGQVFHLDALGTVQALSAADGSEITRYGTDPWGKVLSGSAAGNAYVYHGGLGYWEEPGAGLNYVRARWLEPETGSWLSVDPVSGEPRYAYARQLPTRLVDPSGEGPLDFLNPQLVARIAKFLADPLREGPAVLGDLLDAAHSVGLAPFNTQQLQDLLAQTLRKLQGTQAPRWLEKLAPPPLHDAAGWRDYAAGVLKGILVVLGEFLAGAALIVAAFAFPLVGQIGLVLALVALLIYVCQHGVSLNSLLKLVLQPVQEDLGRLHQAEPLAPGDRGYVAAHLLGNGICLVLLTLFSLKGGKVTFADLGKALSTGNSARRCTRRVAGCRQGSRRRWRSGRRGCRRG